MPLIASDALGNPYSLVIQSDGSIVSTPVPGVTPSTADNSITTNALALITSALRLIGVLASGETADLNSATDSLMVLDQMIDSWNADRLAVYTTRTDDYALVSGQQTYTLGPGGDFNSNRPARIDAMSTILLSNPANPLEIPIVMYSTDDWQTKVTAKVVNGSFPQICYDDGGFPLRSLSFWPIPQIVDHVRIYSWQGLGIPSTLTTGLSFPPGYAEAFRYNLAVRLSAEFASPVSATVQSIAIESLARVRSMNAPDLKLRSDLCVGNGAWDYRADLFGLGY